MPLLKHGCCGRPLKQAANAIFITTAVSTILYSVSDFTIGDTPVNVNKGYTAITVCKKVKANAFQRPQRPETTYWCVNATDESFVFITLVILTKSFLSGNRGCPDVTYS